MSPWQEFLCNVGGYVTIGVATVATIAVVASLIVPWFTRLQLMALEESVGKLWDEIYDLKHPKDSPKCP